MVENIKKLIETEKTLKKRVEEARNNKFVMIKKAREDANFQIKSVEAEYEEKRASKETEYEKKYKTFEKEIIGKNIEKEEELFKFIDKNDMEQILKSEPFECEVTNEKIESLVDLLVKAVSLE